MVAYLKDAAIETSRPLKPGEVQTHEGGIAFSADKWTRLRRFLILGSEAPFYSSTQEMTVENIGVVTGCLVDDWQRTLTEIINVSTEGRAPKNDPAILAMALGSIDSRESVRTSFLQNVPRVCRIGTHICHFAMFLEAVGGGWGRAKVRAVADWFKLQSPSDLAYQAIKYQSRDGWALADLLKLTHLALQYPEGRVVTPGDDTEEKKAIYQWIVGHKSPYFTPDEDGKVSAFATQSWVRQIMARDWLHNHTGEFNVESSLEMGEVAQHIIDHQLPREAVPTEFLNSADVWNALLHAMPMTAMIRSLGKMTAVGLLSQGSDAERMVCQALWETERIRKARVHPIAILIAMKVYEQGHGERGKIKWYPCKNIVNALDGAFYQSFGDVAPTGKRIRLAVDVSASMGAPAVGTPAITNRQAAAAMALVTMATEPGADIVAYSDHMVPVTVRPSMRLDEVTRIFSGIAMGGGTYCSLPIEEALEESGGIPIDAFVSYTDNETWNGGHRLGYNRGPVSEMTVDEALRAYRYKNGTQTRSAVVAFAANEFTLANPNDAGQMDFAGLDAALPGLLSDFIAGEL